MNTSRESYKAVTNMAIANSSSVGMLGKNSGHGTMLGRYANQGQSFVAMAPITNTPSTPYLELNSTPGSGLHPYRVEGNVSISRGLPSQVDGRIRPTYRAIGGGFGGARAA